MRYIIFLFICYFIACRILPFVYEDSSSIEERTIISVDSTSHIDDCEDTDWDRLVDAVIYVESRGNDSAVGDGGKAVGCLQIHPIAVREVNRILVKYNLTANYTLNDRYSKEKSIEMFNIISEEYYCCEFYDFIEYAEIVARRWNGGPRGDKKESTIRYWNKVKKELCQKIEKS